MRKITVKINGDEIVIESSRDNWPTMFKRLTQAIQLAMPQVKIMHTLTLPQGLQQNTGKK